jgi:DNA-binding NtrC family response regulator
MTQVRLARRGSEGGGDPFYEKDDAVRELVGRSLAEVERWLIIGTLDRCVGNRTHAARLLGISIRTLRNKLNEYSEAGFVVPQAGTAR